MQSPEWHIEPSSEGPSHWPWVAAGGKTVQGQALEVVGNLDCLICGHSSADPLERVLLIGLVQLCQRGLECQREWNLHLQETAARATGLLVELAFQASSFLLPDFAEACPD